MWGLGVSKIMYLLLHTYLFYIYIYMYICIGGLLYPRVICSKTYYSYRKPQVILNAIYNII